MGHFGWPQVGHFQPFLRDEKENKVGYFEVFKKVIVSDKYDDFDLKIGAERSCPDGHLKIPHLWPPQNAPPYSLFHP